MCWKPSDIAGSSAANLFVRGKHRNRYGQTRHAIKSPSRTPENHAADRGLARSPPSRRSNVLMKLPGNRRAATTLPRSGAHRTTPSSSVDGQGVLTCVPAGGGELSPRHPVSPPHGQLTGTRSNLGYAPKSKRAAVAALGSKRYRGRHGIHSSGKMTVWPSGARPCEIGAVGPRRPAFESGQQSGAHPSHDRRRLERFPVVGGHGYAA